MEDEGGGGVHLIIKKKEIPGQIVELLLDGVLDANTFEQLDTTVMDLLENSTVNRLLVGMRGVTALSSAGAGALLSLSEQALNAGGGLVLYELQPPVHKTLQILGLLELEGSFVPHRLTVAEFRQVGLGLLGARDGTEYYAGSEEGTNH